MEGIDWGWTYECVLIHLRKRVDSFENFTERLFSDQSFCGKDFERYGKNGAVHIHVLYLKDGPLALEIKLIGAIGLRRKFNKRRCVWQNRGWFVHWEI